MDDTKIVAIVVPIIAAVAAGIGGILKIWLDSRKKTSAAIQESDLEMSNATINTTTLDNSAIHDGPIPVEPADDTKEVTTKEEIVEAEMEGNFTSEETFDFLGIFPNRKSTLLGNNFKISDEVSMSTNNSNDLVVRDIKSDSDIAASAATIDKLNNSVHYDNQAGYESENSLHLKVKVTKFHREQTFKSYKGATILSGSTELKSISPYNSPHNSPHNSPPASPPTLARSCPAGKFKPKPIKQQSIESINSESPNISNSKIPIINIVGENSEEE